MEKVLVVVSGCPASGKSTLINQLSLRVPIISLQIDNILFEALKLESFSPSLLSQSRQILIESTENALKQSNNEIIIVEDTNHLKSLVKPFRRLAKKNRSKFLHVLIKVNLQKAIQRNLSRQNSVNVETILKIHEAIDNEEFFKETFEVFSDFDEVDLINIIENQIKNSRVPQSNFEKSLTVHNLSHQLDKDIRKNINMLVKKYNGDKKEYSQKLKQVKKKLEGKIRELDHNNYFEIKSEIFLALDSII